jgi:hypothetical protein
VTDLDLARVLIGIFCAVLVPWATGLRLLSSPWIRGAAGGAIATYACQPAIDRPAAWVVIAVAVGLAGWLDPTQTTTRFAAAAVLALTATAALGRHAAFDRAELAWSSSRVAVVACGFLLATVVAGEIIAICLRPLLRPIKRGGGESAPELANAGRIIGWVERTIIYAAVLVSHPEAAALIVAVKSLARLDELKEGAFVEYFLIGTLLSLLAALGTGIAVDRLL